MKRVLCLLCTVLMLISAALPSFAMSGYPAYGTGSLEGYGYGSMAGYGYWEMPTTPAYGYTSTPAYPTYGYTAPAPAAPAYPAPPATLKYTITYLPGANGIGSPLTVQWNPGYAILAGQIFTRAGFTQTGWSWSDGGAKAFALNETVPITTNATLYPYWESVTRPLYLTVNYSGYGALMLSGTPVPNGWTGKLEPGQSFTFYLYPNDQFYVYSIFLAGWYRNPQPNNTFMVTYEMMQGQNQTITFRFESIYRSPKTGDDSNIALWAALGGVSLVGLAAILFTRRKPK